VGGCTTHPFRKDTRRVPSHPSERKMSRPLGKDIRVNKPTQTDRPKKEIYNTPHQQRHTHTERERETHTLTRSHWIGWLSANSMMLNCGHGGGWDRRGDLTLLHFGRLICSRRTTVFVFGLVQFWWWWWWLYWGSDFSFKRHTSGWKREETHKMSDKIGLQIVNNYNA
jgi:hypothetical protein